MANDTPDHWASLALKFWRSHGVSPEAAQELLIELFLRYSQRQLLPPWGQGMPPPVLRQIVRDLLTEHWRWQSRTKRQMDALRAHYCCMEQPCLAREIDPLLFRNDLPLRLREVLSLRLEGETCAEIAQHLGIGTGTVKSYLRQLRQKFVEFFGYDPTKRSASSGYISDNARKGHHSGEEEVSKHDTQSACDDDAGSVGGKRVRTAPHSGHTRRRAGGVDPATVMLGKDCGCGADLASLTLPASGSAPIADTTVTAPQDGDLSPLLATCIDVYRECKAETPVPQEKCVDEWWRLLTCPNQYEKYKRWKYRWLCGSGSNVCYVTRCCPWSEVGCCTNLDNPTCQGNDAPCARPVCEEPQVNCN